MMAEDGYRYTIFPTELGWMGLAETQRGIFASVLPQRDREETKRKLFENLPLVPEFSPDCLKSLEDEVRAYFAYGRSDFGCEIDWKWATPFQRKVLEVVCSIPAGHSLTYGEVAFLAGSPMGARAVGNALANNNIPVIIPCHRVVGQGGLGGFTGGGPELKAKLLKLEGYDFSLIRHKF